MPVDMAPKKKTNKKTEDDWEAEALGEAPNSTAAVTEVAADTDDQLKPDEDVIGGGGGLLAAIKRNKQNKKKKGKAVEEPEMDGEDPLDSNPNIGQTLPDGTNGNVTDILPGDTPKGIPAKGKGGKNDAKLEADGNEPEEEQGGLKSKKEKEKEKKEREKQRKKEQVSALNPAALFHRQVYEHDHVHRQRKRSQHQPLLPPLKSRSRSQQ